MGKVTNEILFVGATDGSAIFGDIAKNSSLIAGHIFLPLGNKKKGYLHIEERHGKQILNAGFISIVSFVEYVAKNYTVIREGRNSKGEPNGTYLLQVESEHNDTLYIELSQNLNFWVINSGGVFNKNYGRNLKTVWSASEVQKQSRRLLGFRKSNPRPNGSTSNGTISQNRQEQKYVKKS